MVMLITPKNVTHERKLAEVRLRKTSTFEPDFEGKNGGLWGYNYHLEELVFMRMLAMLIMADQYATQQRKTLRSQRKSSRLVAYFGIKEWE